MGEEPNHRDREKAWTSINHSILFVCSTVVYLKTSFVLFDAKPNISKFSRVIYVQLTRWQVPTVWPLVNHLSVHYSISVPGDE